MFTKNQQKNDDTERYEIGAELSNILTIQTARMQRMLIKARKVNDSYKDFERVFEPKTFVKTSQKSSTSSQLQVLLERYNLDHFG